MLPCSSSSSSSSWEILASRRRFSSAKADLEQRQQTSPLYLLGSPRRPTTEQTRHPLSRGVAGQLVGQFVSLGLGLLPCPLSCSQVLQDKNNPAFQACAATPRDSFGSHVSPPASASARPPGSWPSSRSPSRRSALPLWQRGHRPAPSDSPSSGPGAMETKNRRRLRKRWLKGPRTTGDSPPLTWSLRSCLIASSRPLLAVSICPSRSFISVSSFFLAAVA